MTILQKIVQILRKLYNSPPVRSTLHSILTLYTFLVHHFRERTAKEERFSERPDFSGSDSSIGPSPSSISPAEKVVSPTISASRTPARDSLHPYPFSGPNASVSSQDVSASSVHSDVSAHRSTQQLQSPNQTRYLDPRTRSNPHIDIPAISGQHAHLSGSVSRLSSRPNSLFGQPPGSRPTSIHDQLSVSRPISPYTNRHDSGSQISIPPSITIDRGLDEEAAPMQTSPVQEDNPFALRETKRDAEFKELSEAHDRFHPIPPESHSRYDRSVYVSDERKPYTLKPLTTSFKFEEKLPAEWAKMVHPEGACYYVYQHGRYYTDANIMDEPIKDRIMVCINDFDDFIRSRSIQLSPLANIVFNLQIDQNDPDRFTCEYYIADHATRTVFWLDSFEAESFFVWWEVKGVTAATHIEHVVVSQYWYHCHLFPHSYSLTVEAVDELRDILSHCICDTITSSTSTVPYSVPDLKDIMFLLNNLRKNPATGGGVSAYSRIMYIFARLRFINFYGQPGARLDRDQSIHYQANRLQNRRPWWMKCLSPALFSAPDLYYRILSNLWVDGLVHEAAWADFVGKMNDEWQQLILFNTVLLNANVAFLAIQSIDDSSNSPGRSPAQIASFLSIVASFGSIILGLVLARKHRAKAKDTAADAAKFLNSWERNRLGIASLAILYSVPYALLMWGVLCFLVAFSFMCYSNSDILIRSLMSGSWFIVAVLVLWCVTALASWDHRSNNQTTFWSHVHDLLSYLLFGPWWLIEGAFNNVISSWQLLHARPMTVRVTEQQHIELQNIRKSSVGTAVGELFRKSSLFSRTDRKNTGDTQATAVEP